MAHIPSSDEVDGRRCKHICNHHVPRSRSNPRVANNMKCIGEYDNEFKNPDVTDIVSHFNCGDIVASCWYRSSPLSRPSRMDDWREATVLAANANHTFAVQFFNGEIENNVPKGCLSRNLTFLESSNPIVDNNSSDNDDEMKNSCCQVYSRTDNRVQTHQSDGIMAKLNNCKPLDDWERLLGKCRLREVYEVFGAYALPAVGGESKRIRSPDIIKAFIELESNADKFLLKARLQEMGISPNDTVEVQDFLRAFYCIASSETLSETHSRRGETSSTRQSSNNDMGPCLSPPSMMTTLLPVSKLASSIFSERRWVGTSNETDAFLRRMCRGRLQRVKAALHHARSVFDELCHHSNEGKIASSDVKCWLTKVCEDDLTALETTVDGFLKSLNGSHAVSFPEILSGFGFLIERIATTCPPPTISSAFSMLRCNCSPSDALSVARTVLRYIENIISAPHDAYVRRVSIGNKVYQNHVATYDGGPELIYAAGFRLNVKVSSDPMVAMRSKKGSIHLLGAPETGVIPNKALGSLKQIRYEIEKEIFTLEGAPSIATAIRLMIKEPSEGVSVAQSAVKLALRYVTNILDSPQNPRPRRIKTANRVFYRIIGQFEGGRELMEALGFSAIENGTIYELRCMSGSPFYAPRSFCTNEQQLNTFPSLDSATKGFLLRRMADLKSATVTLALKLTKGGPNQTLASDSWLTCTSVIDIESNTITAAAAENYLFSSSRQNARNSRNSFLPKQKKKRKENGKIASTKSQTKPKPSSSCSSSSSKQNCRHVKYRNDYEMNTNETAMADFVLTEENENDLPKLQLSLIRQNFNRLDTLKEGRITSTGLMRAFRLMGKDSSYPTVEKWIQERDVNNDGCVDFDEFVLSLSTLLPIDGSNCINNNGDHAGQLKKRRHLISTAFGYMRLHNSLLQCCEATKFVINHINLTLASPTDLSLWHVSLNATDFYCKVGSLIGGISLFEAAGWHVSKTNRNMLVLDPCKDPCKGEWDRVPKEALRELEMAKEHLISHLHGLDHPNVFNIGTVSMAVAELTGAPISKHVQCIEMVSTYAGNILKDKHNSRYRIINTTNTAFVQNVASVPGGIALLVAVGFRENDNGALVYPKNGNLDELNARKIELDAGLPMLKARCAAANQSARTFGANEYHSAAEPKPSNISPSPVKVYRRLSVQSINKDNTYLVKVKPQKKTVAAPPEAAKHNRKIPGQSNFKHLEDKMKKSKNILTPFRSKKQHIDTVTTTLSAPSPLHSTQLRIKQLGKLCRPGNAVKVGGGSDHAEEGIIIAVEDGSSPFLELVQTLSHAHETGETIEISQLQREVKAAGSCKIRQCKSTLDSIVSLATEKGEKLRAMRQSQVEFQHRPVNKYVFVSEKVFQIKAGKSNGCGFGVFSRLGRLITLGHKEIDLLVWDEGFTLGDLQRLCTEHSSGDLECISRVEICKALENECRSIPFAAQSRKYGTARDHSMMQDPVPCNTSEVESSDQVNSNDFLSMFYYKRGGSEQSKLNAIAVLLLHNTSEAEWGAKIPEAELYELLEEFSFLDLSGIGHLSAHQVSST